ncbi:MAG TPA: FAD-dependent oxidoreductase [Acidimicrobiales bacterium]|jgi:hypothetical protein|nr:FAD-dependent oxidoreductase [Acidimicrobiales bacterium]
MARAEGVDRRQFLKAAAIVAGSAVGSAALGGCSSTSAKTDIWSELQRHLNGPLVRPGDSRYQSIARPYNARYATVRPEGIALCQGDNDVSQCILWARSHHVPFVIRSGGHSYGGFSTTGGLLISLRTMNGVRMNADGTATLQAGALNRGLMALLPSHGIMIPSGRCPTVAVGGFILGGGFGFSSRHLGLAVDKLVSTRMVTAEGKIVTVDADTNPDLFWALRGGGGGNFGVNVDYTLATTPVGPLSVYKLGWAWGQAPAAMTAFNQLMAVAPDGLSVRIGLDVSGTAPPVNNPGALSVSAIGQWFGTPAELEFLLAPVIAAAKPTSQVIESLPYQKALEFFAANVPTGSFTEKSAYIGPSGFDASCVETAMTWVERWPGSSNSSAVGFTLFAWGGAMNRPARTDTAFAHRTASWLAVVGTSWNNKDPQETIDTNLTYVGDFYTAMGPFVTSEAYQNFIDPALPNWPAAYYGENLPRLVQAKHDWDPDNAFTFAQAIPV